MSSQELLAAVAARLVASRQRIIDAVVDTTRAEVAALDQDATSRSLLEASVTENVVLGVNFVQQGLSASEIEAPSAALAYARALAQRDVPLSALIHAYRIGQTQFLETAFEQFEDLEPDVRVAVVVTLVRRSAEFMDRIVEHVGRTYEIERDRWVASQSGVRQQWVNDLLAGGRVDVHQAERSLGYPVSGRHIAVRLWPAAAMTDGEFAVWVEELRQHIGTCLRARSTLLAPIDEREARLWCAVPASVTTAPTDIGPPPECRLHAAFSRADNGLAGFRCVDDQAARAKEVLATGLASSPDDRTLRAGMAHWIRYDDVVPLALMVSDLGPVRDLVTATLGELAVHSERCTILRETLREFLRHRRSYAATAERLSLHRNSVQYRVQQATALLPDEWQGIEDDLNVRVALEAAHWLGGAALES